NELSTRLKRFAKASLILLAKYREEVLEEQLQLNRLAECAIGLYTATAVLGKLDRNSKEKEGGVFYLQSALDRIDRALSSLSRNQDQKVEELSDSLTS